MKAGSKKSDAWQVRLGWFGFIALCLVVLFTAAPPQAQAADIRSGDTIVIGADQVINDDLFVFGDAIVIDGTVKGDVYAFANTVTINGTVEHDVIGGGRTVTINGTVGDTVRVGGQSIIFGDKANIARSALVGGFGFETRPGSVVGGDLLFGAYRALLLGTVRHDVLAGASGIQINGTVGRNVRVSVGDETSAGVSPTVFMPDMTIPEVPPGLTIAPLAKIGGDLVYESVNPVNVQGGAQVTGPVVQQTPVPDPTDRRVPPTPEQIQQQQADRTTNFVLNELRRFVILLLVGLVVLWLLPKWIQGMAEFIQTKPLGSLGRGILMFVGYILATFSLLLAVVMLAIIFGILTLGSLAGASVLVGTVLFGILTVGYYVFVSYLAPLVVSYLGGHLLLGRVQATWAQNRFLQFIVGLILLSLISLIPILNWFVGVFVAIFALGALFFWAAPMFERKQTPAPAPAV